LDLVNRTPLSANLVVSELIPEAPRIGVLTAKATYRFDRSGHTELESESPIDLFDSDQEVELGLLPRDDLPRGDDVFEIILLGAAHPPGGRQVPAMRVGLSVGRVHREMAVFGDRSWVGHGSNAYVSRPQPFSRMPLTWDRAFGGSRELFVDVDSPVTVSDLANPAGRGFDPEPKAKGLADLMDCPPGFPVWERHRELPNLESMAEPIQGWDDAPSPVCWATVPLSSAFHILRAVEVDPDPDSDDPVTVTDRIHHRAHPDWIIDLPPPGALIAVQGLQPAGEIRFELPQLRVLADYVVGPRSGTLELVPQMLVLLPEEERFYLVFRSRFNVAFTKGEERAFRLRTEPGWYGPTQGETT